MPNEVGGQLSNLVTGRGRPVSPRWGNFGQREATREQVPQPVVEPRQQALVLLLQARLLQVLAPRPQQLQDAVLRQIAETVPCPSQRPC